jgi:hypothetical protein
MHKIMQGMEGESAIASCSPARKERKKERKKGE